jgi:outer membrane protein
VDVLASVQNEFKARRDLLKAQYDFVINLFALNRWAGKLSEGSVASVNAWLSADETNVIQPDASNPKQVSR